jgi:DNA-binding response OmpR family regulator
MKPKVLVAEDNIDHLELLSDALSIDNIVVGTDCFEGCMSYLEKDKYDLVVLDYNLKKNYSGYDILKEINLKYPYLPVIMVTAYGNEDLAVKVMKIGAKDYIRKTLDNNYIERIVSNVKLLVGRNEKEDLSSIKKEIVRFLTDNRGSFIGLWKEKIHVQETRFDVHESATIKDDMLDLIFNAYLSDIEKNQIVDTMSLLKTIFEKEAEEDLLLNMELLNISFKEIAYQLLSEKFPKVFDVGTSIMDQISWIVDANDVVLSKEYEKLIDRSYAAMREYEDIRSQAASISVMKEKMRAPLNEIAKLSLELKKNTVSANESVIASIYDGVKEIETILEHHEKETGNRLEAYSKKIRALKK